MQKEIKYKTVLSTLKKGEKPCYRAIPIREGLITENELCRKAAESVGLQPEVVQYVWGIMKSEIIKGSREGYTHSIPDMFNTNFSIRGVFEAANSTWNPSEHKLKLSIIPKGRLKNSLSECIGVNITEGNNCRVTGIMDATLKTDGVISCGDDIEVYAAGGTFLVDTSAEDEGCWLEDMDGQIVAFGTVTASTATTLDATFATTPEPGNYKFVVATRGGLGPEYGVSIARRAVEVRQA